MEFLLYVLTFLFGYYTHRTFHAYTTAKIGSLIFLHSKLVSVIILLKSIEQFTYAKAFGMLQLQEKGATDSEIKAYKIMIENDVDFFKKQSIQNINRHIPEYLKVLEPIDTWEDAMAYIVKYKEEIPKEMLHDR